jgi:CRISPR-associated endonuclease/helicase Cas3
MKPEYAAHTPRDAKDPTSPWHDLIEHLIAVSHDASRFASKFGAAELARWAGLLHDAGKFSSAFQDYLWQSHVADRDGSAKPEKGKVDHSSTGAVIASALIKPTDEAHGLELPWVIAGHHAGLVSKLSLQTRLHDKATDAVLIDGASKALQWKQLEFLNTDPVPLPTFATPLEREHFVRMLLSCIVDADHSDTEAFGSPHKTLLRNRTQTSLETLLERLKVAQAQIMHRAAQTPVNRARADVYTAALNKALESTGFFRLSVPTGGGKTRSSLAFALQHAIAHGLERVIYVVPYLSITTQIAAEFKQILGSDEVLEHHSGVSIDSNEELTRAQLATENWDAKIIITTGVQFLESLFANKTSKLKKLHRVSQAVVIFDEAQTLPAPLLTPILEVLHQLTKRYHSSIVLCTATQPALDARAGFPDLGAREIAPNVPELYATLKRVTYNFPTDPWGWERVADELKAHPRALCIVNTRAAARDIWQALADDNAIHLSTHLCGAHRLNRIAEIKRRLLTKEECRVVSTQLIEAGVDVDFPVVLRAFAPLDSIVQAAGRCNRNMDEHRGQVIVFKPINPAMPKGDYAVATLKTQNYIRAGIDLDDPQTFLEYFAALHREQINTDAHNIQALRERFDYPEVYKAFSVIESDTTPILIRAYAPEKIREILKAGFNRYTMRQLQPYFVNVYTHQLERLSRAALTRPIPELTGFETFELLEWVGQYHPQLGILEELDMHNFVR